MNGDGQPLSVWRAHLSRLDEPPLRPEWWREAYASPAAFWAQLGPELVAGAPGASKSAVFEWYNLFHEFGQRHAQAGRVVHLDYDPGTGFSTQSYAALTERAQALAGAWRQRGVVPGAAVCLILNLSTACLTCLFAAFYCGATLTILPPEGRSFVRRALVALGKAHSSSPAAAALPQQLFVVAGTKARSWVMEDKSLCLLDWETDAQLDKASSFEPHRYAADAGAVRLFSPVSEEWDAPVLLSADQLYLSALRDGLLLLGLEPGQGVSAPGFCEVQLKPGLLFATLAAGARWVEVSMDEVSDGSVFFEGKVDVLGVGAKLRDLLLQRGALPKRRVTHWLRNLAADDNVTAWTRFEGLMAKTEAVGTQWLANSAAGGSLMFSPWAAEPMKSAVWRSPGVMCALAEPNGTAMEPLGELALLCPIEKPKQKLRGWHELAPAALGRQVIAAATHRDIWVTNLGSHRRGTVLPERQIEELLQAFFPDAVRAAVLVVLPRQSEGNGQRVALLVYVWPDAGFNLDAPGVSQLLRVELGQERQPDQVEIFFLNPKLVKPKLGSTEIDRPACASQFISGTLWSKNRHPLVFQAFAALAREIQQIESYEQALLQAGMS
jgi:hypothetical protein